MTQQITSKDLQKDCETAGWSSNVARAVDTDQKNVMEVLERAAAHKGTSFVEIYQNCHIFNDGVFERVSGKRVCDDNRVMLEHGQPLVFGNQRDRGLRLNWVTPEVVSLTVGLHAVDDLSPCPWVFSVTSKSPASRNWSPPSSRRPGR